MNNLAQLSPPVHDTGSITDIAARFRSLETFTPSMFLRTVLNFMLGFAGVAAFVSLLLGGLQWILAGGDKEGTDKARKRIVSALIGLAIVFSAYALLFIIRTLFNVDLIQFNIERIGS
jgi:hypothetical protein